MEEKVPGSGPFGAISDQNVEQNASKAPEKSWLLSSMAFFFEELTKPRSGKKKLQ
jgi:hypothetical protein